MSAPAEIHAVADACLGAAVDAGRRPQRRPAARRSGCGSTATGPTCATRSSAVHPDPAVSGAAARAAGARRSATSYADRPADLHRLDQQRLLQPDWLQQPGMFGYACYADRFAGDLKGVAEHLDHLEDLGVTYLHLMPLLQPREGDNDGGYAVQDYRAVRVRPRHHRRPARPRDHAARPAGSAWSSTWCSTTSPASTTGPRRPAPATRRTATTSTSSPTATVPDAYERTLPEVFPDFAPGNFTWDDELDGWVWTTFNEWQWDLNWANPAVLCEFAEIILWLANLGVEVLRLDAIAFLWKRTGHQLPEPARGARDHPGAARGDPDRCAGGGVQGRGDRGAARPGAVPRHRPARRPGQRPRLPQQPDGADLVDARDRQRRAGAAGARRAAADADTGTWITYVRCHDDIGWAIDDGDASAAGVTGQGHRRFLSDWYAGDLPRLAGPTGWSSRPTPRPATGGSAAPRPRSPGCDRARADAGVDAALARLFLAHAMAAGWGGVPVIWSGDELGPAQRPALGRRAGPRGRQPLGAPAAAGLVRAQAPRHDLRTVPGPGLRRAGAPGPGPGLRCRSCTRPRPPRSYRTPTTASWPWSAATPAAVFVGLYNVTPEPAAFHLHQLHAAGLTTPYDALGGHASRSAPTASSGSRRTPRGGSSRRPPDPREVPCRDHRLTGDSGT